MLKGDTAVLENNDFSPDRCILLHFDFFNGLLLIYHILYLVSF